MYHEELYCKGCIAKAVLQMCIMKPVSQKCIANVYCEGCIMKGVLQRLYCTKLYHEGCITKVYHEYVS